jgi:hypothetical protein
MFMRTDLQYSADILPKITEEYLIHDPSKDTLSLHGYIFYSFGLRLIPKICSTSNQIKHDEQKFLCLIPGCPLNHDPFPLDHTYSHFNFFHFQLFETTCKQTKEFVDSLTNTELNIEKQTLIQYYHETYNLQQLVHSYLDILNDQLNRTELVLQSKDFANDILQFCQQRFECERWQGYFTSPILKNLLHNRNETLKLTKNTTQTQTRKSKKRRRHEV